MYRYFKKSITRQYLFSLIVVITLALVGAIILTVIDINVQEDYAIERQAQKEKQAIVKEIEDQFMLMVFHVRGYYFLKDQRELDLVYREQERLVETIGRFGQLALEESEALFLSEIEQFLIYFSEELFPTSIQYVVNDDYDALRQLAFSGPTNKVINIVGQTQQFSNEIDGRLEELNEEIVRTFTFFKWLYVGYILLILLILAVVIRKMSKNLGLPLLELTKASQQIINGENVQLTRQKREDEIGILSNAFVEMARSIQSKEEELTAQNEELVAQQEKLEDQQAHLEKSLLELKYLNSALNESAIVAITDYKGRITYANDKFCEISQYTKEELIGKDHRLINSGYHGKMFFRDLWKTILKGEIWTGEIRNRAKDGSIYWVETTIVPYLNDCGIPYQFVAIKTDITNIKLAEQKHQDLYAEAEVHRQLNQDIIDHVNEGISLLDENGTLLQYNHTFLEILGVTQSLQNCSLEDWTSLLTNRILQFAEFKAFVHDAISSEKESTLKYRYEVVNPTHKIFDVYALTIQRKGQRFGTLVVHRDITAEYEVDQMKSELVSTVSHELRTPLASVLGFTELILTKELKPERQKKYLETIHKEAARLTNLINDFLDIQRIESGKQTYEMKRVNLFTIVKEVLQKFKATNKEHQFELATKEKEIYILGDEEKLIQLFTNLLSNAIKFSPHGGRIKIAFEVIDNTVICSVNDQGLGIPKEEVAKLFTKFYRIDNSDRRKIGGTGLGLAICKQIAEAHNGGISVASVLGTGSTFYVKLPVLERKENTPIGKEESDKPLVLIIEDDESIAMLLVDELKELHLEVKHFPDGESAITAIKLRQPELIVLDIMLGEKMDGWAVISELKKEEGTKNIPIVISSALDEKERGFNLGIGHYLTKPYPHGKLSEIVLRLLEMGGKTGEILIPVENVDTEEKR